MFVERLNNNDVENFFFENYPKTDIRCRNVNKNEGYFEVQNIYSSLDNFTNCEIHDFDIRKVESKNPYTYTSFKNLSMLWQKYMTKTFGNEYLNNLENQRLKNIEDNFCK